MLYGQFFFILRPSLSIQKLLLPVLLDLYQKFSETVMKHLKIVPFALYAFLFLTLSSCNNLFEGKELKTQIEDKIAYETSSPVTIRVQGDEKAFEFISGKGDFQLKKTDKITIEFKLNEEEYTFQEWNAVNKNDETRDCSNLVKVYVTNNGNVYKTELTLLENSTDIILTAKSHLKPAVLDTEPKYYPTGVSCYRPIKIIFNQPINEEDLNNFNNIKITNSRGESIHEYFNMPVPSEDKKTYTISPIMDKIKELLAENTTYDIIVTVAAGVREIANSPEVTKETKFSYRIADIKDNFPPQISSLNVYTTVKNLESGEIETKELKRDIMPEDFWTSDENKKYYEYNHITGNSVKIKFTGTDDESGIKALYVKEVLLHNKDAQEDRDTYPAVKCDAVISEVSQNNFESNTFTYELRSKNDGLISLEFYTVDYNDHISESQFCGVTRDLVNNIEFVPYMRGNSSNPTTFFRKTVESGEYTGLDVYQQLNTNTIKQGFAFCYLGDTFMKTKNAGGTSINNKLNIRITYRDDGSDRETEIYSRKNTNSDEINADMQACKIGSIIRDPKKDTYVKFYFENAYDQSSEFTYTIPKAQRPSLLYVTIDSKTVYYSPEEAEKVIYFYQFKDINAPDTDFNEIATITPSDTGIIKMKCEQNKTYRFFMMYSYDGVFYSCADSILTFDTKTGGIPILDDSTIIKPEIKEIKCTPNSINSGTHNVTIEYNYEGDPNYDYRLLYSYPSTDESNPNYYNGEILLHTPSNKNFTVKSCYEYKIYFEIIDPITGKFLSTVDVPEKINATYDNTTPNLGKTFIGGYRTGAGSGANKEEDYHYNSTPNQAFCYLNATDDSIGINEQNIEYWVCQNTNVYNMLPLSESYMTEENKKTLDMTSSTLKYFDLDVPKDAFYTVFYKVLDKNGNYDIGRGLFSSVISGEITSITKDSDNLILTPTLIPQYDNINASPNHICTWYYDSEWKMTDARIISDNTIYSPWGEKKFILNFKSNKDNFFKISTANSMSTPDYSHPYTYNKTAYIVPEYFLDETKVIKKKNILDMGSSYLLFISAPTMVRTLYSSTDWGNDASLWATRGIEANVAVENSDFTYVPAKNKVPAGKYWCVVANYADGTCDMSKVEYQP